MHRCPCPANMMQRYLDMSMYMSCHATPHNTVTSAAAAAAAYSNNTSNSSSIIHHDQQPHRHHPILSQPCPSVITHSIAHRSCAICIIHECRIVRQQMLRLVHPHPTAFPRRSIVVLLPLRPHPRSHPHPRHPPLSVCHLRIPSFSIVCIRLYSLPIYIDFLSQSRNRLQLQHRSI